MAEILGVISSIIAISQAVVSCVRVASDLYRAPEEIQTLEVS